MLAKINDRDPRVMAELVALLYRHQPLSLMMLAGIGGLLVGYMILYFPGTAPVLVGWYLLVLAVVLARFWLHSRYMAADVAARGAEAARWRRRFAAGALTSAICWGALSPLVVPGAPMEAAGVVMLVLAGVCAGAVNVLAPLHRLYVAYVGCILAPLVVTLVLQPSNFHDMFAILFVLLFLLLGRSAWMTQQTLSESLQHRFALDAALERADLALAESERANLLLVEEVAERRRVEAELSRARQAAEAASEAKGAFLANMSHEIRTPMNAIVGMSQLALQLELDDKAHNYVRKVAEAATSLLRIINDVLDFSKIEAGKLELERIPFSLEEVLEALHGLLVLKAEEKGLALRVERDPAIPVRLLGDPARLRQVLLNLASNAVKFTDRGEVVLSVRRLSQDREGVSLAVSVRDTGIGMSAEQCAQLFQSFHQADSSTSRRYGGTGLGLAISQRLVAAMGGRIDVSSAPGVGTVFHFSLRFGVPRDALQAQIPETHRVLAQVPTAGQLAGLRLLLVEDNDLNQELATALLEAVGVSVDVVANGEAALSQLDTDAAYAAILMDCQMPGMDGYEATRRIRADPRLAHLPVIAMTANVMSADRERALAAGMNDYVSKPINVAQLYTTIARWALRPRAVPA